MTTKKTTAKKPKASAERRRDPDCHMEGFCGCLEVARQLWLNYRHLVESSRAPEPLRSEYEQRYPDSVGNGVGVFGEDELLLAGIITRWQPKTSKTLQEIRLERGEGSYQAIADAFTIDGADEEERVALARFQAIYRRRGQVCQEGAPTEELILRLVLSCSMGFMGLAEVQEELDECKPNWRDRELILKIAAEDEALQKIRRARYTPAA